MKHSLPLIGLASALLVSLAVAAMAHRALDDAIRFAAPFFALGGVALAALAQPRAPRLPRRP